MARPKGIDSRGVDCEQDVAVNSSEMSIETARRIIAEADGVVETVDARKLAIMEEVAFMEEVVEIRLAESADPNADNPVEIGCNGETAVLYRGVTRPIKRKFLNSLITKVYAVETPEYTNQLGERHSKIVRHSAQRYPFEMFDKNPKGRQWLENAWRTCR